MALFLSHRGESDDAPENTLPAFELAMNRDSDGAELDVRLTATDELVVCHDPRLLRVAGEDITVADHTLEELRKFYPVPLLAEVLRVIKPGKALQIEIKDPNPKIYGILRDTLLQSGFPRENLAITSFKDFIIREAAEYFGDLPRLQLIDFRKFYGGWPVPAVVASRMAELRCTGVSFRADFAADREFIDGLKSYGLTTSCWGVSDDNLGMFLADNGLERMTCNHAVALRAKYAGRRNA